MNLGLPEMIFIFLLALIIFGPKKLPEVGRQIGRALNEFKRASNEFKSHIESEISQLDVTDPKRQILPPSKPTVASVVTGLTPEEEAGIQPEESPVPTPPPAESNTLAKAPDA
jgi:sec-independent protein translocase protein TatB